MPGFARFANKSTQEDERITVNLLDFIKVKVHTVTSDNGKVFGKHETVVKVWMPSFSFQIFIHLGKEV